MIDSEAIPLIRAALCAMLMPNGVARSATEKNIEDSVEFHLSIADKILKQTGIAPDSASPSQE